MANEKRLIDADAVLRRLQKRREDLARGWRNFDVMPIDAKVQYHENLECSLIVEDTDIVDAVEVVHGRWIMGVDEADYDYGICSVCGFAEREHFPCLYTPNYCPDCGAKMDGDNYE